MTIKIHPLGVLFLYSQGASRWKEVRERDEEKEREKEKGRKKEKGDAGKWQEKFLGDLGKRKSLLGQCAVKLNYSEMVATNFPTGEAGNSEKRAVYRIVPSVRDFQRIISFL